MSYDLMVFDAKKAPQNKEEFLKWYEKQTDWEDDFSYDDPDQCSPALKSWFLEMVETYPSMNDPWAPTDEELDEWEENEDIREKRVTDYSLGREFIYCAFAWSVADDAYEAVKTLAAKHHVGFFDVSGSGGDVFYNL